MRNLCTLVSLLFLLAVAPPLGAAGEVRAISGAVGLEDRARMMREYGDYNLHLAFANHEGEFLAGVRVALRRPDGRVWRDLATGPYFFAQLPQGEYEVTAEFGGSSLTRRVHVGSGPGRMHYFHWNDAAER